jgi:hypothetical protein
MFLSGLHSVRGERPNLFAEIDSRCAELVQIERRHKKLGGIFASAAARGSCLRPVLQCKNLRLQRGL